MSDIEGGQAPGRPGSAEHTTSNRSSSWLGSILHRPRSAPPSGGNEAPLNPYNRFSTVPEEGSTHTRLPSASSSGLISSQSNPPSQQGDLVGFHDSAGSFIRPRQQQQQLQASSGSSGSRRQTNLQRTAEPLQQLYGSGSSHSEGTNIPLSKQHQQEQQQWQQYGGSGSKGGGGGVGDGGVGKSSSGMGTNSTGSRSAAAAVPPTATALGDVVIGRMSTAVKVSEKAAQKYMHMVPEEEINAQMASNKHLWGRGIIHPLNRKYRMWWYLTVLAAAITGWLVPFRLAFLDMEYRDTNDGSTVLEVVLLAIFCMDMFVSFFVGYYNKQGLLVMARRAAAVHYLKRRFFLDILTTVPWDWIVLTAAGVTANSVYGRYIALLGLLKLGRMYRLVIMFYNISYNLNVGLLTLTLTRNFTFSFYLLHWAACGFWFVALQEGKENRRTWVAKEAEMLSGSTTIELYIFSFYWALVTFATLGYGDVTPNTTPEVLYTIVYVGINIVVWAYILGTITLLVTKQDEEMGAFRQRMQSLNEYCKSNSIPSDLKHTMAGLLRLHMSLQNEALGDEQVLGVFPTTIRRKILRQLYLEPLSNCYLFEKTGVKFLDALMLGARVELFLPKVEIVSALDHANELYIVVGGHVEVVDPSSSMGAGPADPSITGKQQINVPGADADDAFKAGMISAQQVQHIMSTARHTGPPATPGPGVSKQAYHPHPQQHNDHYPLSDKLASMGPVPEQTSMQPSGAGAGHWPSRLLQRLPGGQQLQRWLKHGRSDSWRKQQEQLQNDKLALTQVPVQALARASRALSPARVNADGAGHGLQDSLMMPAFAMRHLDSRSRVPLQQASAGSSKSMAASSASQQQDQQVAAMAAAGPAGASTAGRTMLGPGDCFAEVAYFTEVPKAEAVRSLAVCRVLVIPRSTYNAVARDFPLSARQVLENLKNRAAQLVAEFLPRDLANQLLKEADLHAQPTTTKAAAPSSTGKGMAHTGPQSPREAAAAAAVGGAADAAGRQKYDRLSPFSQSDAQREAATAAAATEGSSSAGEGEKRRLAKSLSDSFATGAAAVGSAAATEAALRRLASTAATGRRKEQPMLSTMSVQLSNRYSSPPEAAAATGGTAPGTAAVSPRRRLSLDKGILYSRSTEAVVHTDGTDDATSSSPGTSPPHGSSLMQQPQRRRGLASMSVNVGVGDEQRQARALARFTASLSGRRSKAYGTRREDLDQQTNVAHAEGVTAAAAEAAGGAGDGEGADVVQPLPLQPSSPRLLHAQQEQGQQLPRSASDAPGVLQTLSLMPFRRSNTEVARAMEGMDVSHQQQTQLSHVEQQPQQQQHTRSMSDSGAASAAAVQPAKGFWAMTPVADAAEQQDDQQRPSMPLVLKKLGGVGYEDNSRLYSDEEVQAVAAAVSARLTVQQQRLLADLLRLRQLVNKAAAKYDQMRLTAFLDAAASGDVDVVQDMLRQGMPPNTADYDGRTALMIAAFKGHKDVVLALLFVGADTSLKDARGFDVMIEAARGGHIDIIDVLARSGARAGVSQMLQASLLCKATYEGKLDKLGYFLRAGCSPDAHDYDGQTALHVAAAEGNIAAVRVLVSAGASITRKDRWGYSPLDVAHKVGAAPLVEFLQSEVPPDVAEAAAESWKRERTEAALAAARYGDTAALARLLARGCPVDAADYDGRSLLHVAVTNKQEAVVKQLLAAGANPNVRTSAGSSPLLEAAMNGSTTIQSELMTAGARLGLPATEEAALLSSVLHAGRHDQLLALLTAGADPAAADYDSRTPLHIAASLGDVDALRLMADALADSRIERLTSVNWQAQDRWGDTPLQEAQRAGHEEAAAFLQEMVVQQQRQQQQRRRPQQQLPQPQSAQQHQ